VVRWRLAFERLIFPALASPPAHCRLHAIARRVSPLPGEGGGKALCARGRSRCRARIAIFEEMMSASVMARRLRSPLSFAAEAHNVSGASDPSDHKPRLPREHAKSSRHHQLRL